MSLKWWFTDIRLSDTDTAVFCAGSGKTQIFSELSQQKIPSPAKQAQVNLGLKVLYTFHRHRLTSRPYK
jgi:hypothetical protein